eukprot:838495-Amphidinium_carterae.1
MQCLMRVEDCMRDASLYLLVGQERLEDVASYSTSSSLQSDSCRTLRQGSTKHIKDDSRRCFVRDGKRSQACPRQLLVVVAQQIGMVAKTEPEVRLRAADWAI